MTLLQKLKERSATIGIVGVRHWGLPLGVSFAKAGFRVLGFDIEGSSVSPIVAVSANATAASVAPEFQTTSDLSRIAEMDAVFICVTVALNKHREPDLSPINTTMNLVAPHLRIEQIVCLESSAYPGMTREIILPYIQERGFSVGDDFYLVYSPTRSNPGDEGSSLRCVPRVVGGFTVHCLELGQTLYRAVCDTVVALSTIEAAELTRLLETIQRAVNIGLVNEMKLIAEKMGIDICEVIDAASTKPFGFDPYYPGPGVGGYGVPTDPFHLTWKAYQYEQKASLIRLAGEINRNMPDRVVERINAALNDRNRPLRDSHILALGVAYKPDLSNTHASPALRVMQLLRDRGAIVEYSDMNISAIQHLDGFDAGLSSVRLTAETIATYDCVVVLTDHSDFPYDLILENARLIVDTRGRYRTVADNVVRA